jgi:O-antigen/teichoic acid export membrane protein
LVTQTDKLILSKLLTLTEYAHFSLAVLVASGVLVLTSPISSAMVARLSRLNAEGKQVEMVQCYREVTQLITAAAVSAALVLSVFSEKILLVLTGDLAIARESAKILSLYAIGNGIFTVATFQAYLQFAKGDMKLHVVGNTLFAVFLIPTLIFFTMKFGATGAGYAWLVSNVIYFIFWVPKVHGRFYPDLHKIWLLRDVVVVCLFSFVGILITNQISTIDGILSNSRVSLAFLITLFGIITVSVSSLGTEWMVRFLSQYFRIFRGVRR